MNVSVDLKLVAEGVPENNIGVIYGKMPDWWIETQKEAFSAILKELLKRVQTIFPIDIPLKIIHVDENISSAINQWQKVLSLSLQTSDGDGIMVGGKTFFWLNDETQLRHAVIVIGDVVAIKACHAFLEPDEAERKRALAGPNIIIHEIAHIVDECIRDRYNLSVYPPESLDYIKGSIAESVWEETFCEWVVDKVGEYPEVYSQQQYQLCIDLINAGINKINEALNDPNIHTWSVVIDYMSRVLNQFGRAIGHLIQEESSIVKEEFFLQLLSIDVRWKEMMIYAIDVAKEAIEGDIKNIEFDGFIRLTEKFLAYFGFNPV